ncbi:MAG TPA: GTP cyclohydrolase I [Candidatus Limnocylindria bacterium]|nr:GTP cyclohydrolase I [Candidatus Limnocylindria bacterium]
MTLHLAQPTAHVPPSTQVVQGPITFVAHCDRHGIPFFGTAFVGYVPAGAQVGPATLRRMVKQAARYGEAAFARRLAAMLEVCVRPAGIAVAIQSSHDCAGPRLLAEPDPAARASWHGRYRTDRRLRADFLARCAVTEAA